MKDRGNVKNGEAEAEISASALPTHELYGKGGSSDGRDLEDWLEEERLILSIRKSEK
jgi:hypothetical protein